MSRHVSRQKLALEFGATGIVSERGQEGIARVKELTNGVGADSVLECVGTTEAVPASGHGLKVGPGPPRVRSRASEAVSELHMTARPWTRRHRASTVASQTSAATAKAALYKAAAAGQQP